jgi:hypothetical protein
LQERTLIILDCRSAVNIAPFSISEEEEEFILLPGAMYEVKECVPMSQEGESNLFHVKLGEVENTFGTNFQ